MEPYIEELKAIACAILAGLLCGAITFENCFRKERKRDAER